MKWFNKLVGEDFPDVADSNKVEEIDVSVEFTPDRDIHDARGRRVAKTSSVIDPTTFQTSIRLVIDTLMWPVVDVVCDGNAVEVITKPLGDGRYSVKRTVRGYKPATFEREDTLELREFDTTKQFIEWIESLSTDDVEALRQIYYDQWNFEDNSQKNHMYYELLEEEKSGRKK